MAKPATSWQHPKPKLRSGRGRITRIMLIVLLVVVGLALLAAAFVYLWPLQEKSLQTATPQPLTYDAAVQMAHNLQTQDTADGVLPDCHTILLTHGHRTAQSVVMFHGVSECPGQFAALAQYFYNQGFNVLVARFPEHGLPNKNLHGRVTAQQIVMLSNEAVNVADGLGAETGAVGLSGGGDVATWAAEYRPDTIRRLVVLAPFYAPNTKQAPVWERRLLPTVYGYGLLPDQFTATGLSYHALGQFMRIVANFTTMPTNPNLKSVGAVVAPGDTSVDHGLAKSIPEHLAAVDHATFNFYSPPPAWNLGHDIVKPNNADLGSHAPDVYPVYYRLYQGETP